MTPDGLKYSEQNALLTLLIYKMFALIPITGRGELTTDLENARGSMFEILTDGVVFCTSRSTAGTQNINDNFI